jgi:DNA helicase-2/ATP-dependent DNA helicase PcrA
MEDLLQRILKRLNLNMQPNSARSRISYQKAHGISPDELSARVKARNTKLVEQQELVQAYHAYEAALATSNLLDYDDLLLRCAELLRRHPECVSNVQAVLVDEFQDTNHVQYELMNLFASRNRRITVVGDPDQSIYGFRSAEIKNLARMQQLYKNTSVVLLEDNYRSSGSILSSAQDVIEQDVSRPGKKLHPTHCVGTMPVLRKLPTAEAEAQWIVLEIKRCVAMTGNVLNYSDFAVLLRSAVLSRHIESEMGKRGVPYKMVGGSRFFDRVEVKLLLDYLRVVGHAENSDALLRIINAPPRRVGEESIKLLVSGAEEANMPLWNFVKDVAQGRRSTKRALPSQADQGVSAFVGLIQTGKQKLLELRDGSAPRSLLQFFIDKLSFHEYLKKAYQLDEDNRWANVQELLSQAEDIASEVKTEQDDSLPEIKGLEQQQTHPGEDVLSRFLANVALSTDTVSQESEKPRERVIISTIHAAKGLEWPVVFVPAVYDGIIPHSRAEDSDEERRLLYVAMTRAQALLYLSFPLESQSGYETNKTNRTSFLPDNIIASRFRPTGPSLHESTVYQIADILRRPRPSVDEIIKGMEGLPSVNDDRWTADGVDSSDAVIRWDGTQTSVDEQAPYPKRRRCDQGESHSTTTTYLSSPGYTMSNASNFTVPSGMSLGFSTARECIKTNHPPQPEESEQGKKTNGTNAAGRKKGGLFRGDIANFFGQTSSKTQKPTQSASTNNPRPQAPCDTNGKASQAPSSNPGTYKDSISSRFPMYRPQAQPRLSRPTLEPSDPNKYTWLTGPSRGTEKPIAQDRSGDGEIPKASGIHAEVGVGEVKNSAGQVSDFRQAATFHTTTMSMLQHPTSQTGRKTLGIRRNQGNGWEARMNRERNRNPQ